MRNSCLSDDGDGSRQVAEIKENSDNEQRRSLAGLLGASSYDNSYNAPPAALSDGTTFVDPPTTKEVGGPDPPRKSSGA